MGAVCPLLIQNAATDPAFLDHAGVRVGITCYLGVPIRDPEGRSIGTLCLLDGHSDQPLGDDDIQFMSLLAMRVSAEVERERLVERRVAEHRELNERLAGANACLEAVAEEKRRFVATVIHDLRQPLTAARTVAHLLRDDSDAEERQACLELLDDRLHALGALVDELAGYSEIEAGRLPWRPVRVELRPLLLECLHGARAAPSCLNREICLRPEIDPALGCAEVDPRQLAHIVNNLLANALKFTPTGGISLRAAPDGDTHWRLEIADTGIGIAPEHLARIFDEFYQVPRSTPGPDRGLGLGLAIVRHLCAAAGATVAVDSHPGRGTRFTLRFPRRS